MPPTTTQSTPNRPYVLTTFGACSVAAKALAAQLAALEPLQRATIVEYLAEQAERPSVDAHALLLA